MALRALPPPRHHQLAGPLQVALVQRCLVGQGMIRGDHQGHGDAPQGAGNQLPLGVRLLVADAELGPPALEQLGHIFHQREQQLQLHRRVAAGERLQQGPQPGQVGVIVDGERQARLYAAGQLPGNGLQPLTLGQQHPRLLTDAGPRLGQHRVAAAAIEQLEAEVDLQVGNGGAHHRLRLAQPARRRRERSRLSRRQQRLELFQ